MYKQNNVLDNDKCDEENKTGCCDINCLEDYFGQYIYSSV